MSVYDLMVVRGKNILPFFMTNLICKERQSQWRIGLEQIASDLPELLNF